MINFWYFEIHNVPTFENPLQLGQIFYFNSRSKSSLKICSRSVLKSWEGADFQSVLTFRIRQSYDQVMKDFKKWDFFVDKEWTFKKNGGIFSFLILICSLSNITIFWVAINIFIISGPPSNSPVSSGTREIQNYFLIFKILMIGTFTIHMTRNWW